MPTAFEPIIVDNFNGGEVLSVEPTLLQPNQLQKAINVRFSKAGGVTNRPGYSDLLMAGFVGTAGMQGCYATDSEVFFINNGKIYVTLEDLSNAFEIYTGLSTTGMFQFTEFNGGLYVYNGIDELRRINFDITASALVALTSATLDVKAGQGWKYPTSGNIYVVTSQGADVIAVTSKLNDTLTITAATVDYSVAAGTKIYYTEVILETVAPRFAVGCEFKNTFLGCKPKGQVTKNYQQNTLFYSRGATGANPNYFHDFINSPAGYLSVGDRGGITGTLKTKSYVYVAKSNSISIITDFDATSGAPTIQPLSDSYGAVSQAAMTLVGDQAITFSGKQIKQIGEQIGLNNVIPSINPKFDDKIYTFLQTLDEDQSNSFMVFSPAQRLLKLFVNEGGSRTTIVYDDKIDAFSRDYNKPMACGCVYKNELILGSSYEPKLFLDEIGYDDNGTEIQSVFSTAEFNAKQPRLSKYFRTLYIRGRLGIGTILTVRIYFDRVLTQEFTLDAAKLVTPVGGTPIGRNKIGGSIIGSSSSGALGYDFEIEKLLKKRKNIGKMYIEIESNGVGQVFEINNLQIEGTYSQKFDKSTKK